MINLINKKIGVRKDKVVAYTQPTPQRAPAVSLRRLETASGGTTKLSAAASANTSLVEGYLDNMVADDQKQLMQAYRDMYYNDSICGSAVDLWSELPFSDFQMYGVSEDKLEVYEGALARLNLRSSCSQITRQFLVEGSYTSTLVFDPKTTQFIDQIPYAFEDLTFDDSPLLSQDPVITAKVSKRFDKFLNETSPEWNALRKVVPSQLLKALQSGEFVLDPLSTLYLARRTFPTEQPVSYLKRCLPVYMLEKTLYRGTLFELSRRQRANVLVTAGDDTWEPTVEELSALANLFQQSDLDPMGALIVTRSSVNVSEFRQAGDFIKWTDVYDQTTSMKLKALGISDAFLSSDSSYSNAEQAVQVFMDNLSAYRSYFTHSLFTNKLFPLIAMTKRFYKDEGKNETANGLNIKTVNDYSKLDIPKVRWNKRLSASNDENLMASLTTLTEHGVPIPMRLMIAASGIDPDTLLSELEDDANFRGKVESFTKADAEEEEDYELSSLSSLSKKGNGFKKLVKSGLLSDAVRISNDGSVHHVVNQSKAHKEVNEKIVKAVIKNSKEGK
jgi:hypothetical protein